jgi:hypothetical protein
MKHIGYFDVHLYGADPVKGITAETILKDIADPTIKVTLHGDIVDRKNGLKKLIAEATALMKKFQALLGNMYKTGNHEVNQDEDVPTIIDGWAICHSDMIFNGIEASKADRMVTPGAGTFSRFFKGAASKARDAGLLNFHGKINDPLVQAQFLAYCKKYGATKGVIGGHKHPASKMVAEVEGLQFVIYPRGRHEVTELSE